MDGRSGKLPPLDGAVNSTFDERKRSLETIEKHNNSISEGVSMKKVNSSNNVSQTKKGK